MDKIDAALIDKLTSNGKLDSGLVRAFCSSDSAEAVVRVHNPLQLGAIERNFDVVAQFPFIRSVGIKCTLDDVLKLDRLSEVEYVSAQGKVTKPEDVSLYTNARLDSRNPTAFRHSVGTECAYNMRMSKGLDGSGVTLCVMDTGVAPHSDLSIPYERIVHFEDMIGGADAPYDDNGHGTFVAGVAAGNGMMSGGSVTGVAPKANIVGLKVIGGDGESGTFKILDGMQWLFDNFRQYGIRVVCMSFGAEPQSYADPLKLGVEMLSRSGLIVVAASGNGGENALKSPAISGEIISVGAVDDEGILAPFTSRGRYMGVYRPDLCALGVDVKGLSVGGTYAGMTGTSAAAPYVAGACCLLCQKYKNITPRQAKQALLQSCENIGGVRVLRL